MADFDFDPESVDKVLQFSDPRLRQVSAPVSDGLFDSQELRDWIVRLDRSRQVFGGIGIAAPQIGLFQRLVVIDIPAYERVGFGLVEAKPLHALINPEIVWFSDDKMRATEGCLSVKGYEGVISRPVKVGIIAYSPEGKRLEFEANSLYARALQHEFDHLDGILYPDRIAALKDIRKVQPVELEDPVLERNYQVRPALTLIL